MCKKVLLLLLAGLVLLTVGNFSFAASDGEWKSVLASSSTTEVQAVANESTDNQADAVVAERPVPVATAGSPVVLQYRRGLLGRYRVRAGVLVQPTPVTLVPVYVMPRPNVQPLTFVPIDRWRRPMYAAVPLEPVQLSP